MKERPILFSGPMVRAILEGRKTQTRRVVSPYNSSFGSAPRLYWQHADFSKAWVDGDQPGSHLQYLHVPCHTENKGKCSVCDEWGWPGTSHRLWPVWWPYDSYCGEEMDRPAPCLWVREKWTHTGTGVWRVADAQNALGGKLLYAASDAAPCAGCWFPSIHMPRWASRITLEITDVRVQRLQEISEEDAKAEGVSVLPLQFEDDPSAWYQSSPGIHQDRSARGSFIQLWNSINGEGAWRANPSVWAISFRRAA